MRSLAFKSPCLVLSRSPQVTRLRQLVEQHNLRHVPTSGARLAAVAIRGMRARRGGRNGGRLLPPGARKCTQGHQSYTLSSIPGKLLNLSKHTQRPEPPPARRGDAAAAAADGAGAGGQPRLPAVPGGSEGRGSQGEPIWVRSRLGLGFAKPEGVKGGPCSKSDPHGAKTVLVAATVVCSAVASAGHWRSAVGSTAPPPAHPHCWAGARWHNHALLALQFAAVRFTAIPGAVPHPTLKLPTHGSQHSMEDRHLC